MQLLIPQVDEVLWGVGYVALAGALFFWLARPSKRRRRGKRD